MVKMFSALDAGGTCCSKRGTKISAARGSKWKISPTGKRIYAELTLLLVCFARASVYLKCHTSDGVTAGNVIHVGRWII